MNGESPYIEQAAFPFVTNGAVANHQAYSFGMTKREVFAATALQGLLCSGRGDVKFCVTAAIAMADEMIAKLAVAE